MLFGLNPIESVLPLTFKLLISIRESNRQSTKRRRCMMEKLDQDLFLDSEIEEWNPAAPGGGITIPLGTLTRNASGFDTDWLD